jgi:hypothetical protein
MNFWIPSNHPVLKKLKNCGLAKIANLQGILVGRDSELVHPCPQLYLVTYIYTCFSGFSFPVCSVFIAVKNDTVARGLTKHRQVNCIKGAEIHF